MIKHRRELWSLLVGLPGDAAEIGVAEGFFSADMLAWPVNFPKVYMVDRWACLPSQKGDASNPPEWHEKNLAAARLRVQPFGDRAVFLRGESVLMATKVPECSLALVYIDGDHSYEGVTKDILAWRSKLVKGGVMAFHDYDAPHYGVKDAVVQYCAVHDLRIYHLPEDKPEDAGAYFRC